MASEQECLQIKLKAPTDCFIALGGKPCDAQTCLAADYLEAKKVSFPTADRIDQMRIDHALHHICPQTIHNPLLSAQDKARLIAGLTALLNN